MLLRPLEMPFAIVRKPNKSLSEIAWENFSYLFLVSYRVETCFIMFSLPDSDWTKISSARVFKSSLYPTVSQGFCIIL